ncbi:MAG: hypothetical protein A2X34_01230 [Elusimicrobia bacterium GWC2_51_8]|nr:MAG: hypothetical protein A2X34_01230 [Elusimicrobia bacterium GWC2_51_8]OGR85621.1 MAG: hypothetical protein A2021_07730 [Elusimicrobia bacterium GWF2_52_66]
MRWAHIHFTFFAPVFSARRACPGFFIVKNYILLSKSGFGRRPGIVFIGRSGRRGICGFILRRLSGRRYWRVYG